MQTAQTLSADGFPHDLQTLQEGAGAALPAAVEPHLLSRAAFEWPTFALIGGVYLAFGGLVAAASMVQGAGWSALSWLCLVPIVTLHSSLQHELLHGHPFRNPRLNALLAGLPLGLFVPYWRFRALHIAHHDDPRLTDPYEDPESWYLHPRDWRTAGRGRRALLAFNNTLFGRMLVGPAIGMAGFVAAEWHLARKGRGDVMRAWGEHLVLAGVLLGLLRLLPGFSLPAYLAVCYGAWSLLCVRTFLEHQAEEAVGHRTVIIEDRGPLAFLFLFNSLHAVHHRFPAVPWYRLPGLYRRHCDAFRAENGGYVYRSYLEIACRHAFRAKEPVEHPVLARGLERERFSKAE